IAVDEARERGGSGSCQLEEADVIGPHAERLVHARVEPDLTLEPDRHDRLVRKPEIAELTLARDQFAVPQANACRCRALDRAPLGRARLPQRLAVEAICDEPAIGVGGRCQRTSCIDGHVHPLSEREAGGGIEAAFVLARTDVLRLHADLTVRAAAVDCAAQTLAPAEASRN